MVIRHVRYAGLLATLGLLAGCGTTRGETSAARRPARTLDTAGLPTGSAVQRADATGIQTSAQPGASASEVSAITAGAEGAGAQSDRCLRTGARDESALVELAVPGFEPAALSLPAAAADSQPVLVAAHGAGGDGDWHCELWRELTGNRGYILCPQGVRIYADRSVPSGFYFPDHHHLEREVMAALQALWDHCPRADRSHLLYAGYSQGATMGALMLVDHGDIFSRLVLIEGGFSEWNIPRAKKFRRGGGQRVLFACGVAHCERGARRSARWLAQAEVATRVEYARGAGHTPGGQVAVRLADSFAWLVQGDKRWRGD